MSAPPDLTQYRIASPEIAKLIRSGMHARAVEVALQRLTDGQQGLEGAGTNPQRAMTAASLLSDLACALVQSDQLPCAVKALQEASILAPTSADCFHNTAALLLQHGQLRGKNFDAVTARLQQLGVAVEWTQRYWPLTWMPKFLNLEFVKGKCNLKCRMCVGTNAPDHPNKLTYIEPEDFRRALVAAPTITGVTLSSGDSDPLLHPKLDEIIDIALEHNIHVDIYTNGLPLGERMCRRIVESQAVTMINFSIDAATAETYKRIRGGNFERLQKNISMLCRIKAEHARPLPALSLSLVAMADNIEELPAFVEMGRRFGAYRVFVEDLLGWLRESGGNHPATDNPRCHESVSEALRLAEEAGIWLHLPERLRNLKPPASRATVPTTVAKDEPPRADVGALDVLQVEEPVGEDETPSSPAGKSFRCCSWINGVWVSENGDLHPCCMVSGVADMGNTADGPVYQNDKYNRVKSLLAEGKVFRQCTEKTMCAFVQQQKARGREFRFITSEELGDLDPFASSELPRVVADPNGETRVSLPVLT